MTGELEVFLRRRPRPAIVCIGLPPSTRDWLRACFVPPRRPAWEVELLEDLARESGE